MGYGLLRKLCAPSWKPLRLQFSRIRPENNASYRQLFGSRLRFDAEVSGVAFASFWRSTPVARVDPALQELLANAIERAQSAGGMTFAQQVSALLRQAILGGNFPGAEIAGLFGMDERTLRKRLKVERASWQELVNQTRFELARQRLRSTRLTISEIAAALRCADSNVFSRAFRNWVAATPQEWRNRPRMPRSIRARIFPFPFKWLS